MFTTYRNISFIAKNVTGLEVDGKETIILSTDGSFTVNYKSNQEALDDLPNLTAVINAATGTGSTENNAHTASSDSKVDSVQDTITSAFSRLRDLVGDVKSTANDKIQEAAQEALLKKAFGTSGTVISDLLNGKDELLGRAQRLLESLDASLNPETEKKPMATRNEPAKPEPTQAEPVKAEPAKAEPAKPNTCFKDVAFGLDTSDIFASVSSSAQQIRDAKKLTVDEFSAVFGTPNEPVIGDLSERQLREFIGEFIAGALENERVQQLFQNIKDQFGEDEAEGAIEGYKNLVLTICLQNVEMTLSEIIQNYFS